MSLDWSEWRINWLWPSSSSWWSVLWDATAAEVWVVISDDAQWSKREMSPIVESYNDRKIDYSILSEVDLLRFRSLCPNDEDVYRLSWLSSHDADSIKRISIKMNKNDEFVFSLKSKDGFLLQYTVNIDSRICTINNIVKKTNDRNSYKVWICKQLRNMKSMGIKEVHLWAAKFNGKYGYNIRPLYWYDIQLKEWMIDSLDYMINYGKDLSFNWLYTDNEIKNDLRHFMSLYWGEDNTAPDLLMPLLFEWPKLRNMWRQSGMNMSLRIVLMKDHPTRKYFDEKFPESIQ